VVGLGLVCGTIPENSRKKTADSEAKLTIEWLSYDAILGLFCSAALQEV